MKKKKLSNNKSSKNLKRRELDYLILLNRLPLANFLTNIGVTNNPQCRLCKHDLETQKHLFYDCEYTKEILDDVRKEIDNLTFRKIITHEDVNTCRNNEILSIYKQTIWGVRGEIFSKGVDNLKERIKETFREKIINYETRM